MDITGEILKDFLSKKTVLTTAEGTFITELLNVCEDSVASPEFEPDSLQTEELLHLIRERIQNSINITKLIKKPS